MLLPNCTADALRGVYPKSCIVSALSYLPNCTAGVGGYVSRRVFAGLKMYLLRPLLRPEFRYIYEVRLGGWR